MKTSKYFKQARMLLCYGSSVNRATKGISYRRLKGLFKKEGFHLHRSGEIVRGLLVDKKRVIVEGNPSPADVVHAYDSCSLGAFWLGMSHFKSVNHLGGGLHECVDFRGRKYHVTH